DFTVASPRRLSLSLFVSVRSLLLCAGGRKCLVTLGDNMSSQPDNAQDITAICRSWDDFQMCVSGVLSRCSGDAADIWESLRAESRRMQLSGNLYEWCAGRTQDLLILTLSVVSLNLIDFGFCCRQ
uniref:Neuritin 1-like b n=1 Tax=Electrophorus electricus TaxID=8005 RepID=A0A4W4GFD1_ELEEL